MDTIEEYALKLGKFWVNFNTLELLLRIYLAKSRGDSESGLELQVGDSCSTTYLTNYDTFGILANRYNSTVPSSDQIDQVEIVRLRDAIAHGRSITKDEIHMTLLKFSKPDRKSGMVKVVFREVLTGEYLDRVARTMHDAAMKIHQRIENEF